MYWEPVTSCWCLRIAPWRQVLSQLLGSKAIRLAEDILVIGGSMGTAELAKQFRHLMKNPIPNARSPGISAAPSQDDPLQWRIKLTGPRDTPYHGGWFDVRLEFPRDFPRTMPKARFVTPIWHPNVASSGRICVDMERNNTSGCAVECILMGLHMLLASPNPDSALNGTCARQFKNDYDKYRSKAAEMTRAYAMG